MGTFMANAANIERKWYVVDAEGKAVGRVADKVAALLKGKMKPTYTPHVDCGDFVIVINADKAILTGNKNTQKLYRHHTGWVGGLKEVQYGTLMNTNPEFVMELAVKRMLPNNTIGRNAMKRLHVYSGDAHKHEAQKPEKFEL